MTGKGRKGRGSIEALELVPIGIDRYAGELYSGDDGSKE